MKFDRVIDLTLENERALLHGAQLAAAVAASQYPIFMMSTLSLAQNESMQSMNLKSEKDESLREAKRRNEKRERWIHAHLSLLFTCPSSPSSKYVKYVSRRDGSKNTHNEHHDVRLPTFVLTASRDQRKSIKRFIKHLHHNGQWRSNSNFDWCWIGTLLRLATLAMLYERFRSETCRA